jgi:hypothetical protein
MRVSKMKQSDGTLEDMWKDEVLFEKTNEDIVTVSIASVDLTQATAHNITLLEIEIVEFLKLS